MGIVLPTPGWSGAVSFPRVWEVARDWASGETDTGDDMPQTSELREMIGGATLELLAQARVICVDPDQVSVLPDWSSPSELHGVGRTLRLPFDVVYLDLERSGYVSALALGEDEAEPSFGLGGALCWHENDLLHIVPMGGPSEFAPWPRSFYELIGRVTFGLRGYPALEPAELRSATYVVGPVDGHYAAFELCVAVSEADQINTQAYVAMTSLLAARALSVLYLFESANVELVEEPVSRQARRQAERKGEQIAMTVRVRPPRRRVGEDVASAAPGKRDFSYRFEVRGHWNHVTRWPVYEAGKPSPCVRCSRPCRRIWIPPHVKGPLDKPFVPKVRLWEAGD